MPDVTAPFGFPYPEDTDLVRDGAADIEALAEGVNDQLALGFQLVGTRYYTSSGTFVKADPFGDSSFDGAKLRALRVRLVGAGGGGGATASTAAGQSAQGTAGAGGGYAESFITDIAGLDSSVTVTRGAGGAGGAAGANSGSAGGSSSFGALVVTSGGQGGSHRASTSSFPQFTDTAPGGIGSLGDVVGRGSAAVIGVITSDSPAGNFAGFASGGFSRFSSGPRSGVNADGIAGINGSGGSGPFVVAGSAARPGGAGGNGLVIVDVFA